MIDSQRLESIVSEAGRIAYDLWPGAGNALDAWEKKPGDPVCEADLAVDAFLKRELGALLPSAGWLSEETADDPARLGHDLIWLVDPVDGTRDFIRGRSGWAVNSKVRPPQLRPPPRQCLVEQRRDGGRRGDARKKSEWWAEGRR